MARSLPQYKPFINIDEIDPFKAGQFALQPSEDIFKLYEDAEKAVRDSGQAKRDDAEKERLYGLKQQSRELAKVAKEQGKSVDEIMQEVSDLYGSEGEFDAVNKLQDSISSRNEAKRKQRDDILDNAHDRATKFGPEMAYRQLMQESEDLANEIGDPKKLLGTRTVYDPKIGAQVRKFPDGSYELIGQPREPKESGGSTIGYDSEGNRKLVDYSNERDKLEKFITGNLYDKPPKSPKDLNNDQIVREAMALRQIVAMDPGFDYSQEDPRVIAQAGLSPAARKPIPNGPMTKEEKQRVPPGLQVYIRKRTEQGDGR